MVDVGHSFDVEVPIDFPFDYVSNIHNLAEWMYGLQRIAVVGDIERGPGAIYEGTVKLGATLHTRIEVTGWEPGSMLTTESQSGFGNCSTWRFIPLGAKRSRITSDVTLRLPGGLVGKALGKTIQPFIAVAIRHSDIELRRHLEQRYQANARVGNERPA